LAECELYNWVTGQQCFFTSLPGTNYGGTGVFWDKSAAICGGINGQGAALSCNIANGTDQVWNPVGGKSKA